MAGNNLFDIKKRVIAANQTRKITRTMELIASSRLQRGKAKLAHFRVWAEHMQEAAACLADRYFEPLGKLPADSQNAYIVFGGSKGLSGYYSPSLLQYATPIVAGHIVMAVGSAAEKFFPDAHSHLGNEVPSAAYTQGIAQAAMALYEGREAKAVYMVYAKGSQHVTEQLLPLAHIRGESPAYVIAEPSPQGLNPVLYREYVQTLVHEAHLQAFLAEQIARVAAMDSATRNADEIIENLQTTYNRIRQASITQEIVTVSNAVKGDGGRYGQ